MPKPKEIGTDAGAAPGDMMGFEQRFYSTDEVREIFREPSRTTLWRQVRDGAFPRPSWPTPGRNAWWGPVLAAHTRKILENS